MTATLVCTVKGLTNGRTYTFRVKALSGAGWGASSESSNAVTPRAKWDVTLVITGVRQGRVVTVTGASTGLTVGDRVTPWVRMGGGRGEVRGRPVTVDELGAFAWSRRVADVSRVRVHFTYGDARSNVLTLRR
jgi:hypothetical protein